MTLEYYGCHWMVENPISSLAWALRKFFQDAAEIFQAPRLAAFLSHRPHHFATTWLGMFGAPTPKAVKLVSDDFFIGQLRRTVLHKE